VGTVVAARKARYQLSGSSSCSDWVDFICGSLRRTSTSHGCRLMPLASAVSIRLVMMQAAIRASSLPANGYPGINSGN